MVARLGAGELEAAVVALEADLLHRGHQFLQPAAVLLARAVADLRMVEGRLRRLLDRHELSGIAVVLDVGEGLHDLRMAAHERHAPADHVEALRERMDLDADLLRPLDLEEAQRRAVVAQ